jgi:O-antigen/teichoic acid export membrane protein
MSFNFFRSVMITLMGSLIIMGAGLLTGSLTARLLGPEGRGEFASIQLYGALFASMVTSGLPAAVTYFTGLHPRDASVFWTTGILFAIGLALPVVALGYVMMPYLLKAQSSEVIASARVYLCFVPLGVLTSFCLASLQGQMNMRLWNVLRVLASALWLLPLALIYVWGQANAIELSSIYLMFLLIYALICCVVTVKNNFGSCRFDLEKAKDMWRYGLPTSFSTFGQQSNLRLDQILISAMLPPQLLGVYVVAMAWSAAHSPITNAVSYVIVPQLTRISGNSQKGQLLARITRISMVLNVACAAAVILSAPFAVPFLFSANFETAVPICFLLVLGSSVSGVKVVYAEGLRGSGYPAEVMRGELWGLIASLVLFPVMLNLWGLEGVAFASLIGHVITLTFLILVGKRLINVTIRAALVPQVQDFFYIVSKLKDMFFSKTIIASKD